MCNDIKNVEKRLDCYYFIKSILVCYDFYLQFCEIKPRRYEEKSILFISCSAGL